MKEKVRGDLRLLSESIEAGSYDDLEWRRLSHDIESARQRLEKREYLKSDFSLNRFHVPERTREFYIYMEFYCRVAKSWARLLETLDLGPQAHVIDLCPGWTPKVELALFYREFRGAVTMVDLCQDSMDRVVRFMELFEPRYRMHTAVADLFSPHAVAGSLVFANHVIDDLILSYFAPRLGFDLEDVYATEDSARSAWAAILARPDRRCDEIAPVLSEAIGRRLLPGGVLILSQYAAYMERLLEIYDAVAFSKRVLGEVVKTLEGNGFLPDAPFVERAFRSFDGQFTADEFVVLRRP